MDTAFNPKVILAADGSRPNLIEFARRKAYTVLKTGMSSAEFGASVGPQGRGAPPINGDANLITFGGAPADQGGGRDRRGAERLGPDRAGRGRSVRQSGVGESPRQAGKVSAAAAVSGMAGLTD